MEEEAPGLNFKTVTLLIGKGLVPAGLAKLVKPHWIRRRRRHQFFRIAASGTFATVLQVFVFSITYWDTKSRNRITSWFFNVLLGLLVTLELLMLIPDHLLGLLVSNFVKFSPHLPPRWPWH